MVDRLFKKVSYVQIIVNAAASIAMIVDNIVCGKFLGLTSVAAYGAVAPLLLLIMAISQVLSTGGQMKCSEELGKGNREEANGIASLTVLIGFAFSLIIAAVCFVFHKSIVGMLGPEAGTELYRHTVEYLLGFIIGAPGFIGMLILIPFIQLDGNKKCVINATIVMTVADCAGDICAVTVFHSGMAGIGLASSFSYYCALFILVMHFVKKKGNIRIGFGNIRFNRSGEIFGSGIPAALQKVLRTLLSLTINHIVLFYSGDAALGIFTVINSIINLFNSVGQGMGAATLLLTGVFFAEEDKDSIKRVVRSFLKNSVVINLIMMVIVCVMADPLIHLFTKQGEVDIHLAAVGLRIAVVDFLFFSIANCFKNFYQGTKKQLLTYAITVLEAFLFSALAALPLTMAFGVYGVCSVYAVGDLLTIIAIYIVVCLQNKSSAVNVENFMLLKGMPDVTDNCIYKKSISSLPEAAKAASEVEDFVKANSSGNNDQLAGKMSLCVEEICKNVITYGFTEKKKNHLEIFAMFKEDHITLRIRDDCPEYNPVEQYKEYSKEKAAADNKFGLKIVFGVVDNINYFGTLGLNTLVITT